MMSGKRKRNRQADYKDCAVLYRPMPRRTAGGTVYYRRNPHDVVGGVNFYARKEMADILAYLKTIDNDMTTCSAQNYQYSEVESVQRQ
ncbi:MAG: 3'-5' exonuclease [Gallintestinimicrobium sp.]